MPAAFIASAAVTYSSDPTSGATLLTALVPTATQEGDTLLFAVPSISSKNGDLDVTHLPPGWVIVARFVSPGSAIINIARRTATDLEPPAHTMQLKSAVTAGGALLVYRGLDVGAAAPLGGGIVDVSSSANFDCPSLVLTSYSDLYLGFAFVASTSVQVTSPAGTVERFQAAQFPLDIPLRFEIFELLREATGATGTQTAVAAFSVIGLAASVLLKSTPPHVAPSITPDIPGALGFVTVGV